MDERPVRGTVAVGWEPVADVLAESVTGLGDTGAALCCYHDGRRVVDLEAGTWAAGGLAVVRSVSKGVTSVLANLLWQRGELDLDSPVAQVWPEFGAAAKGGIPVRWLFTHQAGLCAIDAPIAVEDALSWERVVDALAEQVPLWEPGRRHGYHALTFGYLTGEVVRRATGRTVGEHVARELAGPLGIDLWIGLPAEELPRVQPLLPALPPPPGLPPDPLAALLADPRSLASRSFFNPPLLAIESSPAYLRSEQPATNGVSDARSLARLYAATIGEVDGVRVLDPATVEAARAVRADGEDAVTGYHSRFGTGFQRPFPMRPMAGEGTGCFGHYGLGGPLAFADPDTGLAFAYVTLQVQSHPGLDPRSRRLAEAARRCAQAGLASGGR